MKKRMTSLLLALLMVLTLLPTAAWAEETVTIVDSGTCGKDGDNLTWTFDSNYVLTISGEGEMADYEMWGTSEAPWKKYEDVWVNTSEGRKNHSAQELYIGDGVTYVGDNAFDGMSYIKKARLPETLTAVGECAFSGTGVTELPSGLVSIGSGAFHGCDFVELVIPKAITDIPCAFENCSKLKKIVFHDNVKSIANSAFMGCDALETLVIPEGVETIGSRAFYACKGLQEVTIADSVTDVGTEAFHCCYALNTMRIGKNAQFQVRNDYGRYAIFGGGALTTIEVDPENPYYTAYENALFSKDMTTLLQFPDGRSGAYTIHNTVKTVGQRAFWCAPLLTSVAIPEGVEKLEECVFASCLKLETVYWPRSLKTVDFAAFGDCSELSDIYYAGSEEEWNAISFYEGHYILALQDAYATGLEIHYNYELPLEPGNVNGQGGIDATDVQCLFDFLLGRQVLTESQQKAADYNGDGVVDVYDLQALYEYVAYHSN